MINPTESIRSLKLLMEKKSPCLIGLVKTINATFFIMFIFSVQYLYIKIF